MSREKISDGKSEKYTHFANASYIAPADEGSTLDLSGDIIQGYDNELENLTYRAGIQIYEEAIEDDQHGVLGDMPQLLSKRMAKTMEKDCANIYNRAFNSSYTGGDGKVLCASDHPLMNGGSDSNVHASGASSAFSESSLETAMPDFEGYLGMDGDAPVGQKVGIILVPLALKIKALQLVGSELEPWSDNNTTNVFKDEYKMQVLANPYLTSATAWFVLTKDRTSMGFGVVYQNRKPMTINNFIDNMTDSYIYKVRRRHLFGFVHPYGVYGSPGA